MCLMGKKTHNIESGDLGKDFTGELHLKETQGRSHKSFTKRWLFTSQKDFPKYSSNEFHCVLKIGFTPNFSATHKGMLVNLLK